MEYEGLADVAPGRSRGSEHDEDKEHDGDSEGGTRVYGVNDERHHDTRNKPDLREGRGLAYLQNI